MADAVQAERRSLSKKCVVCKVEKLLSEFNRHAGRKDGRDCTCKSCTARRGKEWYRQRQKASNGLYSSYVAMRHRCHYPKHEHYSTYGGRGIRVCQAWLESFEAFQMWAERAGYRPGLQIDRIDNDEGYCPENCRFVTPSENARNKRKREKPIRNNSKLNESEVREIRALLARGIAQREIGRRFDVTNGTIWAIKHRRTWTDVV